jgi:NAD(P)-dependent dehydrogenase (short-subunit alcohol dehydrogenase family)
LTELASDWSGKVALITGGTSGIGLDVARRFLAKGARVAITGRDVERGSAAEAELGSDAVFVAADASDADDVERSVTATLERFETVDVLVNNAGIADHTPTVDVTLAAWQRVIDTNLTSAFVCSREALKIMKQQRRGRIINIGSVSARSPRPDTIGYAATKFALEGLTRSLALDGREFGVAASILHPGVTTSLLSGMTRDMPATEIMPAMEVARIVVMMATLPDEMNLLEGLVLPIGMKFLGRG